MILAAILFLTSTQPAPSLTVFARDLDVSMPVSGRVVAVFGNLRIDARVGGDVIVWGGNVSFGPGGEVLGNLSVFGGDVSAAASGRLPVRGTVSTPGALLRLYLEELHRAPWATPARFSLFAGVRVMALSAWLAVSLLLLYLFASPFARAAASADDDFTGSLLAGALGVLTLFLAASAALALLPAFLSMPVAVGVGLLGVAAKIFGMGALFLLLGQKLTKNFTPARRPAALAVGFALLAAFSLLPLVGGIVWSAASIVAVGIAFLSRFGRPRLHVRVVS